MTIFTAAASEVLNVMEAPLDRVVTHPKGLQDTQGAQRVGERKYSQPPFAD